MTQAQVGARTWTFTNDPGTGTLTRVTDPLAKPTDFTYYTRGLLKTIKDANDNTTTYGDVALTDGGYAATGQPGRITDATGQASTFVFDYLGRLKQTTDRNSKLWKNDYDRWPWACSGWLSGESGCSCAVFSVAAD